MKSTGEVTREQKNEKAENIQGRKGKEDKSKDTEDGFLLGYPYKGSDKNWRCGTDLLRTELEFVGSAKLRCFLCMLLVMTAFYENTHH